MLEGYLDSGKARGIAERAGLLHWASYLHGPEGAETVYEPTEPGSGGPLPGGLGLGVAFYRVVINGARQIALRARKRIRNIVQALHVALCKISI